MSDTLATQSGLDQKTIDKIISVLSQYPELEKAVLYGSRAKGNYRQGSDIDLTFFGENLSYEHLSKIAIALDDLLLPYSFDLSLFKQIDNPDLIDHIQRVGIIFLDQYIS